MTNLEARKNILLKIGTSPKTINKTKTIYYSTNKHKGTLTIYKNKNQTTHNNKVKFPLTENNFRSFMEVFENDNIVYTGTALANQRPKY